MLDQAALAALAAEVGFSYTAPLKVSTIELKDAVRDMCAVNTCGHYGKNWACPPGCGTLDECCARVAEYEEGILVQTVGELEDALDGEGMMEAAERHGEQFNAMYAKLRELYPHVLAIGAGSCKQCASCTYPDEPCRFPDRRISSMEAYGMMVMEVCKKNGLSYYYGSDHIAYTSCFLLRK
ncbi:MAG: DUF2284 domain-containing protein [Oscillospiraceae bacterium]|nr:DUF2284 domain-containing protein [Oscillospiraceae bacterium]